MPSGGAVLRQCESCLPRCVGLLRARHVSDSAVYPSLVFGGMTFPA